MNKDHDDYWEEVSEDLARFLNLSPLSRNEAEEELKQIKSSEITDEKMKSILHSVFTGKRSAADVIRFPKSQDKDISTDFSPVRAVARNAGVMDEDVLNELARLRKKNLSDSSEEEEGGE